MGLKTNRNSSNWFAKVGSDDNHVIIAGCQIHYAIRMENEPNTGYAMDHLTDHSVGCNEFSRPTHIYIAQ